MEHRHTCFHPGADPQDLYPPSLLSGLEQVTPTRRDSVSNVYRIQKHLSQGTARHQSSGESGSGKRRPRKLKSQPHLSNHGQ